MSNDERQKFIDRHVYAAMVLTENLWDHVYDEMQDGQKTIDFISMLLSDLYEFHQTHLYEECAAEEQEMPGPGTVIPFPGNKDN